MNDNFIVWLSHTSYLGWATIFFDLLKNLAWPATVMVIVWRFRASLERLAREVAKFEGFGLKLDFKKQVGELIVAVEAAEQPISQKALPSAAEASITSETHVESSASTAAETSGPAAPLPITPTLETLLNSTAARHMLEENRGLERVMAAWEQLVREIRQASIRRDLAQVSVSNTLKLAQQLQSIGAISETTRLLIERANDSRNAALQNRRYMLNMDSVAAYEAAIDILIQRVHIEASPFGEPFKASMRLPVFPGDGE